MKRSLIKEVKKQLYPDYIPDVAKEQDQTDSHDQVDQSNNELNQGNEGPSTGKGRRRGNANGRGSQRGGEVGILRGRG